MQKIKNTLFQLKHWISLIFTYGGMSKLDVSLSLDYDEYWKNKRQDSRGVLSSWQQERAKIIVAALEETSAPISIGDIGCGEGSILKYIAAHHQTTKRIGYDNSEWILNLVKNEREAGKEIETHYLDLNTPNAIDTLVSVDYHLILEVLEHVPHPEKVLAAAFAKSNKGVFFSIPNSGFIVYRLRLLFGKFPKQWVRFPNEHLRFWTLRDVHWWLIALGYSNYHVWTYKGVPILKHLWPALFAAGIVAVVRK